MKASPETKIAVIGRHAKDPVAGGGGSANLNPYYITTPLESIRATNAKVQYSTGTHFPKTVPLPEFDVITSSAGKRGFVTLNYLNEEKKSLSGEKNGENFSGHKDSEDKYRIAEDRESTLIKFSNRLRVKGFPWTFQFELTPKTTGDHTFGLILVGKSKLLVNEEVILDNWNWSEEVMISSA